MRLAAGLCPDLLGELQRSPKSPSHYKKEKEGGKGKGLGIGRERRRLGGRGEVGRDGKGNGGLERGRMVGGGNGRERKSRKGSICQEASSS